MIPRTFPSILEAFTTKMVVYVLPSISGRTAWIDYIPVKGVLAESNVLQNTYANNGYQVVKTLEALTGKQAWVDYIPVFESSSYNKPWSTDAGGYIPVAGLFSVASLFSAGEQGVWYDPSDYTTLFQDSVGTTPVTAVEQPVGLMLDKSKGLVLGNELVTNGTFDTDTAWTKGTGWTISGGVANVDASVSGAGVSTALTQNIPTVAGRAYKVTFDLTTSGTVQGNELRFSFGGTTVADLVIFPRGSYIVFATSSTSAVTFTTLGGIDGNETATIDNISVRELPGNHAFQTTSASRPVLSARVNLLTKTEQFDDAVWDKATGGNTWQGTGVQPTITANYGIAPNGTQTADRIQFNRGAGTTSSDRSGISSFSLSVVVADYKTVIYVKPLDSTTDQQLIDSNIGLLAAGATPISSIADAGNGWKILTRTYAVTTASAFATYRVQIIGSVSPQTMDLLIWGADLRVANDGAGIPAYQRVNTATDYDTQGFPTYLRFDGSDDWLQTNSIDFTAGNKMTVFAGVRKLSDVANYSAIVELSTTPFDNNGSIQLNGRSTFSPTGDYGFASKGTVFSAVAASGHVAPVTNVLTGIGNISGDSTILRINGTQASSSTADQGTGNYGNYPLYIGRRGGTTLPFNGRLYSLIVRGAASDATQISNTETFVNSKTKAYTP